MDDFSEEQVSNSSNSNPLDQSESTSSESRDTANAEEVSPDSNRTSEMGQLSPQRNVSETPRPSRVTKLPSHFDGFEMNY